MSLLAQSSPERKLKLCVMPICKGKRYDLVHKFPMDNQRAEQWLTIIDIPELNNQPLEHIRKRHFICSKHFRKQDYKNCESRSLNKTANPSLLLKGVEDSENKQQPLPSSDCARLKSTSRNTELLLNNVQSNNHESSSIDLSTPQSTGNQRVVKYILYSHTEKNSPPKVLPKVTETVNKVRNLQAQKTEECRAIECGEKATLKLQKIPGCKVMTTSKRAKIALPKSRDYFGDSKLKAKDTSTSDQRDLNPTFEDIDMNATEDREVDMEEKFVTIYHKLLAQPLKLNSFWLRDHCRCSKCYSTSFQRSFNILDISLDVDPIEMKNESKFVHIKWNDGHQSTYSILELQKLLGNESSSVQKVFWSKSNIEKSNYARVTLNDYLCNDDIAKDVVRSLIRYGCAFIENVPANVQSTEIAIKRLFPIQTSIFGDSKIRNDSAYTNESISVHNDNTYFNDAAGLKVLHCVSHTGTGGESLLVDGFHAIKSLLTKHPTAYEYLRKTSIPAEHIEDGCHFKVFAPVIIVDPTTNELCQIRFNMSDRAPLKNIPQDQVFQFYRNYRLLTSEVLAPENEWSFKLNPGTVCIVDNWRVLHGRNSYTGRRQMVGCYVARCEFLSVARKMGITN